MNIRDRIKRNEGTGPVRDGRFFPYLCPAGKLTIGYGRNLSDVGISQVEADILLDYDIGRAMAEVRNIFEDVPMTEARFHALVDMRFQLGLYGLLKFKAMVAAIKAQDWRKAAVECLDSDYARQCPLRAQENAIALETG